MTDYDNLIECLKQALTAAKAKGMTRRDIAWKAGVTETSIYNYSTGNGKANAGGVISVINACGYHLKFTLEAAE